MKIIKSVAVKHVLTEKMREELIQKFEQECATHEQVCEQLYFEEKKLLKQYKEQKASIVEKFAEKIKKRRASIDDLQFQIQQIKQLPLGSELKEKDIDSIVEVNEGDNWAQLMGEETVIIKDGIIQEIRRAGGLNK